MPTMWWMIPHSLNRPVKRVTPVDALRIGHGCSHVAVPAQPAASGYRYVDLGGDEPPFYVRRFALGERSAAVCLRAPVERSSGEDAERGAAALARCELTVGWRRIPWSEVLTFGLHRGESGILAQRALDAICELEFVDAGSCPLCCGDEEVRPPTDLPA